MGATSLRGSQARLSETLRLAIVYRLAHELNAELSSADVLRRVLHAAAAALGTPHASLVALHDQELRAAYALGAGGGGDPRPVMENVLANGLAGFVLHNYRTVIVNDVTNNPLWMPLPDEPLSPQAGSALCVPLIHAGDVVGVMTLAHPTPSYFTAEAVNLTNTISEMGAAALSNALLLEEARQARQQYRTLFDDAIVPIIITDLQGHIQTVNRRACEFLGYPSEEFAHLNIKAIHRFSAEPFDPDRFEHLERGFEVRFQSTVWTKDGVERPVQVYARRVGGNGDTGDHIQWIEHDLTSQLALEQLRQDLSAMVYHDMRGPLGNIHTSVESLEKKLADHPDQHVQQMITIASRSEQQLRRMIDSLLDVQRLEEGSKLLNRTTSALLSIITGAVEQIKPFADDKCVPLHFTMAEDMPLLYIDADIIERVVINLLDNAIKYSPDGSPVVVSAAAAGSEVYVRVRDSGPGVPSEAQATIFDKFSRVRRQNMPHGVGLGLAFCKLAVEAHGGRIWVKNNDEGGATFTFALPVEAPATKELPLLGMATS
jgi:NtrC-family two-component system sensor histidine kinase KinB